MELDLNEVVLLRHVPTRWLTLQPAVVRVLSQWPAIIRYFKELSSADKSVEKNEQYKSIKNLLDNPNTFVQLQFVADIAPLFSSFLSLFQNEGPMIHVLHSSLCELTTKLLLRFMKTDVVGAKSGKDLSEINVRDVDKMRALDDIEIGEATKKAMSTNIKKERHKQLLMDMRSFFYLYCRILAEESTFTKWATE